MTLEEFERYLLTHSSGRIVVPANEVMAERVWTGMKRIARDTIPLKLVTNEPAGSTVLRHIDESTYVKKPEKPKSQTAADLEMDDMLMDALAYYVLAGLEVQRSKMYMGMYWGEIDAFNGTLIEFHLNTASNDAPRFRVFP